MRQDALQQDNDAVDRIVRQWREQRPDLDADAKHVTGRIIRLASLFQEAYGEAFADLGITEGDYGILAPLRRAGAPFRLTPTELSRERMITSGGMTAALDRLERKGLLRRVPNPADRRGSLVELTATGTRVVDEAMERHARVEHELVSALARKDRRELVAHLRTLLAALDQGR